MWIPRAKHVKSAGPACGQAVCEYEISIHSQLGQHAHCNMISMDTSQDCTTDTCFFLRIHHCHHLITPETPLCFLVALLSGGASSYVCGFILPTNSSICDILVSITTPTPTVSHSYWSYLNSISLQELVQHCPKGATPCRSFHSKADAWILWSGACEQGGLGHVPQMRKTTWLWIKHDQHFHHLLGMNIQLFWVSDSCPTLDLLKIDPNSRYDTAQYIPISIHLLK